jgi:AcrR family transcriptional regulator
VERAEPSTRPYRSALRAGQAQRTRTQIAHAARTCFLDTGWAGTSVRAVAAAAGVSEATVYAVYGSKAGLAESLVDFADAAADVAGTLDALAAADGDPHRQLAVLVGFDRRIFEHVLRVIVEGRRQEPALAAAYAEGRRRGDHNRREVFASWPASVWRKGVGPDEAVDVFAVLCSIETYDVATRERGWSAARLERWWFDTLRDLLLAEPAAGV